MQAHERRPMADERFSPGKAKIGMSHSRLVESRGTVERLLVLDELELFGGDGISWIAYNGELATLDPPAPRTAASIGADATRGTTRALPESPPFAERVRRR